MSRLPKDRFTVVPAVYLIFHKGNEVLLLKRANTGYHDGEYSLPAGHVDGGEPAIRAAVREAAEEVGANILSDDLSLAHTMHRFSSEPSPHERIDLYFEVRKWQGEIINAEPHKCSELRWASLSELPVKMIPEVRQALLRIASGEPYSDYNFADA